jgi:hypothetical protein
LAEIILWGHESEKEGLKVEKSGVFVRRRA